jgi:hypothetical protein
MGNNPSVVTENFSTLAKAEEGKPINDHAFWIPLFYEAEVLLEGPVKVRASFLPPCFMSSSCLSLLAMNIAKALHSYPAESHRSPQPRTQTLFFWLLFARRTVLGLAPSTGGADAQRTRCSIVMNVGILLVINSVDTPDVGGCMFAQAAQSLQRYFACTRAMS